MPTHAHHHPSSIRHPLVVETQRWYRLDARMGGGFSVTVYPASIYNPPAFGGCTRGVPIEDAMLDAIFERLPSIFRTTDIFVARNVRAKAMRVWLEQGRIAYVSHDGKAPTLRKVIRKPDDHHTH